MAPRWGSLVGMRPAAAEAAVGAEAGDSTVVGLAAQSLLEGHILLPVCLRWLRALVVVSMNRASGTVTLVCLCHSDPAVETAIERQNENNSVAAVGYSSLSLRGCEIVMRYSSFGFASARADVV